MLISNLENVKKEIQAARKGEYTPWIFKEGKLADDVILIDALEVMDAFAKNIVKVDKMPLETQEKLIDFIRNNAEINGNTYNYGGNITNDMNYNIAKIGEYYYALVMFHLGGDIRGNYTHYLLLKFENIDSFFCVNENYFSKEVNSRYYADVNIFSELYSVYDSYNGEDVGEYYELEVKDLLQRIREEIK